MLHKTRAISLHFIRYKESSIIARFFTEKFGLQSFVVNGVRSAKSKMSAAYFQPLQLLELVQYHDEKKDLHRLQEVKSEVGLHQIPISATKSAMAIFAAELISKLVKEGQSNSVLFELVWNWAIQLDKQTTRFETCHIELIWQILEPMGIQPESGTELLRANPFSTGNKEMETPEMNHWIEGKSPFPENLNNRQKQWLLDQLLFYLQKHLEGAGNLNSLQVLREVFR